MQSLLKIGAPVICDLQTSELDTFWSDEGSISETLFDIQNIFYFIYLYSLLKIKFSFLNSLSIDANHTFLKLSSVRFTISLFYSNRETQ